MGPTTHKLRNTAAALGIDLSEDVPELTQGNREFLFTKEVRTRGRKASGRAGVHVLVCGGWIGLCMCVCMA
jgi:hypothetical protein